jgi:hypothetical protein
LACNVRWSARTAPQLQTGCSSRTGRGAGKSLLPALAQELANRSLVDLVIVLTISPMKINLLRFFQDCTRLSG